MNTGQVVGPPRRGSHTTGVQTQSSRGREAGVRVGQGQQMQEMLEPPLSWTVTVILRLSGDCHSRATSSRLLDTVYQPQGQFLPERSPQPDSDCSSKRRAGSYFSSNDTQEKVPCIGDTQRSPVTSSCICPATLPNCHLVAH